MDIQNIIEDQFCKWCDRELKDSFITAISDPVKKETLIFYPVLCFCGGISNIPKLITEVEDQNLNEGKDNR